MSGSTARTGSNGPPVPVGATPLEPRWWGAHVRELRWQAELARLLADPVWRGRGLPRGDGGPVLLVPGFLAGDPSMAVLARWLRRLGHRPVRAGIAFNVRCSACCPGRSRGGALDGSARRAGDLSPPTPTRSCRAACS